MQTQLAPIGMQAQIVKRSVRESNPVFVLTTDACCRKHLQTMFWSDPGMESNHRTFLDVTQASSPLDHGSFSVTRVGVEPAKSQILGLLALPVCVPVMFK